jgi:hypothetical protein
VTQFLSMHSLNSWVIRSASDGGGTRANGGYERRTLMGVTFGFRAAAWQILRGLIFVMLAFGDMSQMVSNANANTDSRLMSSPNAKRCAVVSGEGGCGGVLQVGVSGRSMFGFSQLHKGERTGRRVHGQG